MRGSGSGLVLRAAFAVALAPACTFTRSDHDLCRADSECAAQFGIGWVCDDGLCQGIDDRCEVFGSPDPDAVAIGLILPATDDAGAPHKWGPYWQRAVMLAVNELNPPVRGGIGGRPLGVISCDSGGDPAMAALLAHRLVRSVPVIISNGSAETLQIAQVTIPAGVLLVSGAATSPELTTLPDASADGVGLVWRTTPSDEQQAQVLAVQIEASAASPPRVAVLARDDVYGQGLASAFEREYSGEATTFLFPPGGRTDLALAQAAASRPGAVVAVGFPEEMVPLINGSGIHSHLRAARWYFTQGARFPELFSSIVEPSWLEGARGTSPAFANYDSPAYGWFAPQMSDELGARATDVVDLTHMFDAAMLVAIAAGVSGADEPGAGASLARVLTRLADKGAKGYPLDPPHYNQITSELRAGRKVDIEGASGQLDFDAETGEALGEIEVWEIRNGAFETVPQPTP